MQLSDLRAEPADGPSGPATLVAWGPEGRWDPLPAWASWFIAAGIWLWANRDDNLQPVLVVSVPARGHASIFAALGLLSVIRAEAAAPDHTSALERLRALPSGTQVRFRQGNVARTGEFVRVATRQGEPYVVIRARTMEYWEPASRAASVEPLAHGTRATGRARPMGRTGFLVRDVFEVDPIAFETHSSTDVVVVGSKEQLFGEAELRIRSRRAKGQLSDLLRPRGMVRAAEAHRTEFWSASSPVPQVLPANSVSSVLDGSRAVVRFLDALSGRPLLVILDRTDTMAMDAVSALASHRAAGGTSLELADCAPPPPGIEVAGYRRRRANDPRR